MKIEAKFFSASLLLLLAYFCSSAIASAEPLRDQYYETLDGTRSIECDAVYGCGSREAHIEYQMAMVESEFFACKTSNDFNCVKNLAECIRRAAGRPET
ncbi:MAG: hypothetical protein K2Q06_09740 [Parvularculaceae bacterium]|nr:hypothetical protein [Parvularculaceae bacterium]